MSVGVIGATGLVGQEMLRILEERAFPVDELRAYASPRSEGRKLPFAGGEVACEVLRAGCFDGLDLVIVDVDDPLALEWAPQAAAAGAQGHRQLGRVPHGPRRAARRRRGEPRGPAAPAEGHRVVPELHDDGARHRARAAAPRRAHRPHGRVDLPVGLGRGPARHATSSTRSGRSSTARAEELRRAGHASTGSIVPGEVWAKPIAGNVIPLAGSVKEQGYTSEEWKLVYETPQDPPRRRRSACTATCVRVPVYVGHTMSGERASSTGR